MSFVGGDAYIALPFTEERLHIARADVGIGPYGRAEEPAAGRDPHWQQNRQILRQ